MWYDDAKHKCSKTSFDQKAISKTALSVALPFAFIRRLCPSPLLNIRIFCSLRCFHCFSKLPRDQRHRCDTTPNIVRNIVSVFHFFDSGLSTIQMYILFFVSCHKFDTFPPNLCVGLLLIHPDLLLAVYGHLRV